MVLLDSCKEVAPWTTLLVCVTKIFMFVGMRWGNTTSTRPWTTLVWSSCMMYLKLMPTRSVRCWNTVMVMTWTSISNRWAPVILFSFWMLLLETLLSLCWFVWDSWVVCAVFFLMQGYRNVYLRVTCSYFRVVMGQTPCFTQLFVGSECGRNCTYWVNI